MTAADSTPAKQDVADSTLALAVTRALRAQLGAQAQAISVDVSRARVTLRGSVDWDHERQAAVSLAAAVPGVGAVDDQLHLRLRGAQPALASSIQHVLVSLALEDARQVQVIVDGSVVTLRGHVHSHQHREAAVRAVAGAPGVSAVVDELTVLE